MKHYLPSFAFSWPLPFLFRWGAFWWLVMFSWCEIWLLFHQQSIRCINLFKTYQCTLNKYIPQKCLFFFFWVSGIVYTCTVLCWSPTRCLCLINNVNLSPYKNCDPAGGWSEKPSVVTTTTNFFHGIALKDKSMQIAEHDLYSLQTFLHLPRIFCLLNCFSKVSL